MAFYSINLVRHIPLNSRYMPHVNNMGLLLEALLLPNTSITMNIWIKYHLGCMFVYLYS